MSTRSSCDELLEKPGYFGDASMVKEIKGIKRGVGIDESKGIKRMREVSGFS
jgi:hypothetical protein